MSFEEGKFKKKLILKSGRLYDDGYATNENDRYYDDELTIRAKFIDDWLKNHLERVDDSLYSEMYHLPFEKMEELVKICLKVLTYQHASKNKKKDLDDILPEEGDDRYDGTYMSYVSDALFIFQELLKDRNDEDVLYFYTSW